MYLSSDIYMRNVLLIMFVCLLSGCIESAYQRNYIISQFSEEENQEQPKETIDVRW